MLQLSSSASSSSERIVLKIIVLGASNVGKTSMMKRYVTDKFTGNRRATIGADFMTKKVKIEDTEILLQIWDTAGQERFHQGIQ
jgi:Ras-related protein Rab-7A